MTAKTRPAGLFSGRIRQSGKRYVTNRTKTVASGTHAPVNARRTPHLIWTNPSRRGTDLPVSRILSKSEAKAMKKIFLAGVALAALAVPASAADLATRPTYKAPVAIPVVYNWSGVYIGAHVGGAWGDKDWTLIP